MEEEISKIEEYINYREKMEYKKLMGYSLSSTEIKTLDKLKIEALKAKYILIEENKRIKKMIKTIK